MLSEEEKHKAMLKEGQEHALTLAKMVDDYFQPPNIMKWSLDGKWDVYVRRKGSHVSFWDTPAGGAFMDNKAVSMEIFPRPWGNSISLEEIFGEDD